MIQDYRGTWYAKSIFATDRDYRVEYKGKIYRDCMTLAGLSDVGRFVKIGKILVPNHSPGSIVFLAYGKEIVLKLTEQ